MPEAKTSHTANTREVEQLPGEHGFAHRVEIWENNYLEAVLETDDPAVAQCFLMADELLQARRLQPGQKVRAAREQRG